MIKESGCAPSQVGVSKDCWMQQAEEAAAGCQSTTDCSTMAQKMHTKNLLFCSSHSPPDKRKKSVEPPPVAGFNCGNWVRGAESVIWRVSERARGLRGRISKKARSPSDRLTQLSLQDGFAAAATAYFRIAADACGYSIFYCSLPFSCDCLR